MTLYARIIQNQVVEYPVTQLDIMKRYPNVSFVVDPFVPPQEYQPVMSSEPPKGSYQLNVVEGLPSQTETGWTQTWLLLAASAEEIITRTEQQGEMIRSQRNHLLAACDYTRLDDVQMDLNTRQQWVTYRNSLRDITSQSGFPWNVEWPVAPGSNK